MTDTNASLPTPAPTASMVASAVIAQMSSAVAAVAATSDGPAPHWVFIERQYGPDLMVGPYATVDLAADACQDALLIDGLVEEDCLDCFTTADQPTPDDEQVLIDPLDKDHFGRPGIHAAISEGRPVPPRSID